MPIKMSKEKHLTAAQFTKIVSAIETPQGFTGLLEADRDYTPHLLKLYKMKKAPLTFTLKSITDDIKIEFDQSGSGHTSFKAENGNWRTFDRVGVDDSFYFFHSWSGKKEDCNQIVKEQLERIEKARAYQKTALQIPSIPFTVAPDELPAMKTRLKQMGYLTFMPAGFGTGYTVAQRRKSPTYAQRASAALEQFLGCSPLFVSTFDAD